MRSCVADGLRQDVLKLMRRVRVCWIVFGPRGQLARIVSLELDRETNQRMGSKGRGNDHNDLELPA